MSQWLAKQTRLHVLSVFLLFVNFFIHILKLVYANWYILLSLRCLLTFISGPSENLLKLNVTQQHSYDFKNLHYFNHEHVRLPHHWGDVAIAEWV